MEETFSGWQVEENTVSVASGGNVLRVARGRNVVSVAGGRNILRVASGRNPVSYTHLTLPTSGRV